MLGYCLKSCEESGRFYQQSGRFSEFRSQQSERFCRFRSQQSERFCESRSEQSGRFWEFRGRSGGDSVSLAVRNRESMSRSKRGVGGRAGDQSWNEMKSSPNFAGRKISLYAMVKC